MPKVYDPILCMMVDKPATRTTDAKVTDGMYMFEFKSGRTDTMKLDSDQEAISMGKQLLKTYNEPYAKITTNGGRNAVATVGTLHDKSTIDKAIKIVDGATGDKLYSDVKAIYNLFSNILLTYSNEQSVQKLANEGTKKCLELAAKVKGVRDEAIRVHDAKKLELGTDERQNVRKAIQLLKNAASLVNNVAMDVDNRRLGGVVNNIQNDISILEDML